MSYETVKHYPSEVTKEGESHILLVKTDKKHPVILFKEQDVVLTDHFRVEFGWADYSKIHENYEQFTRVECTRVLASCPEGHDHGVYYQSPTMQELWQVMYAIGEVNSGEEITEITDDDIFKEFG